MLNQIIFRKKIIQENNQIFFQETIRPCNSLFKKRNYLGIRSAKACFGSQTKFGRFSMTLLRNVAKASFGTPK